MKNNLILFSVIASCLILTSCSKESDNADIDIFNTDIQLRGKTKVSICHHTSSSSNPWIALEVSEQAVKSHLKHGDAVDMDGDGIFHIINGCSSFFDLDDNNPDPFISCYPMTKIVYLDEDLDGLGDPDHSETYICGIPGNGLCECCEYVDNADDCNDLNADQPLNEPCDTGGFTISLHVPRCIDPD